MGVHLYATNDANVWAADDYLALHTMRDGPLLLNIGGITPVEDALTGRNLGQGPHILLDVDAGETRVLKIR